MEGIHRVDAKGGERLFMLVGRASESRISHGSLQVGVVEGGRHFNPTVSVLAHGVAA